ncbi:MAG TPA: cytochrome c [Nitrospiraceae bacterium]|jgi:mono/diheme cytochrome c family protein|nr:cytochrome c [Nitrospiraceae bacterium]
MRQTTLRVALFACSASVSLAGPIDQAVYAAGDPAKGQAIYQAKCITCHGPQGKGDGPIGPQLKPPAADFTNAESKKKSADELRSTIENGKPNTAMVAWKSQLSASEIDDVLAYVLTLRK